MVRDNNKVSGKAPGSERKGMANEHFLLEQIHIKRVWTSVEVAACLDVGAGEDNRPSVVLAGLVMGTALDKNKIKYPKSMC